MRGSYGVKEGWIMREFGKRASKRRWQIKGSVIMGDAIGSPDCAHLLEKELQGYRSGLQHNAFEVHILKFRALKAVL